MLKRKIENIFFDWKSKKDHNPLVIKGVRQCGKTFSVLNFARKNYKHVIYLNFLEDSGYKSIFAESLNMDNLMMYISAKLGRSVRFERGETCLILDEIQECPEARTALKFIKLSGKCDVMATGSLLGVSGYKEPTSIPVGYETIVDMKPLDFEEFLWANGISEDVITAVCSHVVGGMPIPAPLHQRFRELLVQYIVVGGMPAIVNNFLQTRNLADVYQMQRDIVRSYEDDMVKHASRPEKSLIKECFNSIPAQLGKENKKFQYSTIKKGSTASRYLGSLQWIEDAGIINRCYNLNITELPLEGNAKSDCFKVYMADTGLFVSMLDSEIQSEILEGNLLAYKGAVFENIMADFLSKASKKLYYYHKDSGLEVDFVTQLDRECVLIEIKAVTGNIKSSKTLLAHPEKYHVSKVFKFGDYNVGHKSGIVTLPLYLAPFLFTRNNLKKHFQ